MRRAALIPWLVAVAGAAAYVLVRPPSTDLAAQEYRAQLVRDAGLTLWDNGWYGGHHTLGYSVLFPPLGALVGVREVAAIAAVAAVGLFVTLARRHFDEPGATLAALWFAVAVLATLASGRLTFMLGVAIATGALLALQSGRVAAATALATSTTLAGPVAAVFLVIAVVAWGIAERAPARAALVTGAALVPELALLALFPEGGTQPFDAPALWPALLGAAIVALLLPRRERALRVGAGLFALACLASFAVQTPLGNNVARLGALAAGPVLLGACAGRRRSAVLAVAALPLAYATLAPAVRDVVRAAGDPATTASYYRPLVRYLRTRGGGSAFRVEIPFTQLHWEAVHVARSFPLARGWERQLDRRYGALFYDGSLSPTRYRTWLDGLAVAYVALPDVALDASARAEARLIVRGLPYLHQVWHDAHWRVFAVAHPAPLVSGAAHTLTLQAGGFTLRATRPGVALVRIHHTPWWRVSAGHACVGAAPSGGMTRVQVHSAGTIRVQASLTGSACR